MAGLAAWVTRSILARTPRTARWWPFVGSTAIHLHARPSYLADGASAAALICIKGLATAPALSSRWS